MQVKTHTSPAVTIFLLAFLIRCLVAGSVSSWRNGALFQDDRTYLETVRAYAAGGDPGRYWNQAVSFIRPLGWIARWVGDGSLLLLSVSAAAGALTATFVFLVLQRFVVERVAVGGGLIVALFPSQVLWSSLLLRDAYIWMGLSLIALVLSIGFASGSRRGSYWVLALVPLIWWYLFENRMHTAMVAVIATVGAVILTAPRHRIVIAFGVVCMAVMTPAALGYGPAGLNLVATGTGGIEDAREREVAAGATTIDCIGIPLVGKGDPAGAGWRNDALCAPSGVRLMLLDPMPNQLNRSRAMIPAFAEHLIWYPLLLLAMVGILRHRRWHPAIAYTALVAGGTIAMWALIDRNFGTAYRHRGEFVWSVVVLAALGLQSFVDRPVQGTLGRAFERIGVNSSPVPWPTLPRRNSVDVNYEPR